MCIYIYIISSIIYSSFSQLSTIPGPMQQISRVGGWQALACLNIQTLSMTDVLPWSLENWETVTFDSIWSTSNLTCVFIIQNTAWIEVWSKISNLIVNAENLVPFPSPTCDDVTHHSNPAASNQTISVNRLVGLKRRMSSPMGRGGKSSWVVLP